MARAAIFKRMARKTGNGTCSRTCFEMIKVVPQKKVTVTSQKSAVVCVGFLLLIIYNCIN